MGSKKKKECTQIIEWSLESSCPASLDLSLLACCYVNTYKTLVIFKLLQILLAKES